MCISDEIQTLLDLAAKLTGNSYYLCDLDNVRYVSSPTYKSLKEISLSKELLSFLLNKSATMAIYSEDSIILNDDNQIKIFEDESYNTKSTSQIISYIICDDELIGTLIATTGKDYFSNSNVKFVENIVYFITKCIWYYTMGLEEGVDNFE